MIKYLLLIQILCFTLTSCHSKDVEVPFNKIGWNTSGDGVPCPPLRNKMLKDLLRNHKLVGLTCSQIREKLGAPPSPENWEQNILSYEIAVNYGWNIDPVYIKILNFYYNKDSIITHWKIEKTKK